MKIDPQILDESPTYKPTSNNDDLLLQIENQEIQQDSPQKATKTPWKNLNCLNLFWKKLVFNPKSLSQSPNSSIATILEEEQNISVTPIIRSVLAKKLNFPLDSAELSTALEACNKIFHEDYPFDFILEYKGKRLGMILLDRCYNSKNEENLIYRFNANLKSFEGIF